MERSSEFQKFAVKRVHTKNQTAEYDSPLNFFTGVQLWIHRCEKENIFVGLSV